MKKLNRKKGFTIVELVIVIAVVGVLTAVLVPTFVNLTNRAKEAENQTFVRNINTQLAVEEADPSVGRYERVSDAIKSAQRMGFDVTKLTPVDGNDVVWDSAANRFAIVKPAYATNPTKDNVVYSDGGIKATEVHEIWKMYGESEMPSFANQTYSIYAKGQWNATEVAVKTGFDDAGQGIKVTLLKEESPSSLLWSKAGDRLSKASEGGKTFVIENSSLRDIVINYPEAKVIHYGDSGYQTFNALSQYDERGSYRTRDNKSANSIVSDAKATGTGTNNMLAEGIQVTASKEHQTAFVLGEGVTGGFTVNGQEKTSDVAVDGEKETAVTKASTLGELVGAISAKKEYIMLTNHIETATGEENLINFTYSATLDGNGFKLYGNGGTRRYGTGKNDKTNHMICFGNNYGKQAPERAGKVIVKNINIETTTVTRPLECRGYIDEIVLENVKMTASGPSNDQGFTYGGNENKLLKLTVKDCDLAVSGDGYAFILFNPVDMKIVDSKITGWAGLYFKSPNSSHGSRDSIVDVTNSSFVCHNENWGTSNSFGAIVFEDGNINVTLTDSSIDVTEDSDQIQEAILFSSKWAEYFGTNLRNGHVTLKGNCNINGTINCEDGGYDISNDITIEGGTYTVDPTDFVGSGHKVIMDGSLYTVK